MAGFQSGDFYGASAFGRRLPGLGLAHINATIPEHEVKEHSHEGAHFVLATRGRYISTAAGCDDHEGPVLIYNPPDIVHRDRFAAGNEGRDWFFALSFDGDLWAEVTNEATLPAYARGLSDMATLRATIRLLRAAGSDAARLDLETLALELVAGAAQPHSLSNLYPSWLDCARSFIADNACDDIGVADVAEAAGVHRVYLARQYRRWLGHSPGDDLRRRRVDRATHLMMTGKAPLSDIALAAGFCDQSHLNRVFAAHWGMSPAQFQRLTR